jgi:Holliday junction DNA helicase RuvA
MIAYLKGKLMFKFDEYIVIDVGGIGYKVFMSKSAIEKLQDEDEVKVFTYLRVMENDMSLFGFNTNEELHMFELLISVGGIGAKSAITILSNISPSRFALAVITNDINTLKKLQGIGPKTAQRIILELKDKIKTEEAIQSEDEIQTNETENKNEKINEAISALQVLGYTKKEIEKAIESANNENGLSVEDIIKLGLKNLSK